jgi:hypothetical protein
VGHLARTDAPAQTLFEIKPGHGLVGGNGHHCLANKVLSAYGRKKQSKIANNEEKIIFEIYRYQRLNLPQDSTIYSQFCHL